MLVAIDNLKAVSESNSWSAQFAMRITVFVSYCHSDIERDTLEYLILHLEDSLGPNCRVLYDQRLRFGEDWSRFMEMVDSVDRVLLLLTPGFKTSIVERRGGVYEEYRRIWDRYNRQPSEHPLPPAGAQHRFQITPVLLSGTNGTAVPDDLRHLNYADLVGLRPTRESSGDFRRLPPAARKYLATLNRIASEIVTDAAMDTAQYRNIEDTWYGDLFIDLKAGWDTRQAESRKYLSTQLVKTTGYQLISRQQVLFVVGRKGSGKSTLTQVVPLLHGRKYTGVIKINADEMLLESLYALSSDRQFRSDAISTGLRQSAFEFTWEGAITLAVAEKIVSCQARDQLQEAELEQLVKLVRRVHSGNGSSTPLEAPPLPEAYYFSLAFDFMMRFLKDCIDRATRQENRFIADIHRSFTREYYLRFLLGREELQALRRVLQLHEFRFLLTFDGLDTAFDSFRLEGSRAHNQAELHQRARFEIDWLRSLLALVMRAREQRENYVHRSLHFCVAAPMDRFLEIIKLERDSYRNWNRWCSIRWSGIELAILLRKRLEGVAKHQTTKRAPRHRLEEVLGLPQYRHIPQDLRFDFNGKSYSMPLFLYVLRHTFFRPRDLLFYYARILALGESLKRSQQEITPETLRRCIKSTTRKLIESEFMGELTSSILNIDDVISAFRGCSIELDFSQISQILEGIPICFAVEDLPVTEIGPKVRLLYEVGFLGFRCNAEQQELLGVGHEYAFQFTEGSGFIAETCSSGFRAGKVHRTPGLLRVSWPSDR